MSTTKIKPRSKFSTVKNPFNHSEEDNVFRKFLKNHISGIKKLQNIFIIVVCIVILVVQVAKCIEKYMAKSTGTADKYVHVSKTAFPELTICPTYPYKLDVLQDNGINTRNELRFGSNWISDNPNKSPEQFYNEITLDIKQIVHLTTIYVEQVIDGIGSNIVRLSPNETICGKKLFYNKEYYFNGDCFATVLPECILKAGPLEIVFEFHDKTDIFIHHFGQFLSPNSRSRVDVDKGKFIKIAINHEVVKLLSGEDFGNCVENYGSDADFDHCMYSKLHKMMMDEIGCTVPWLPDKSKICIEESKRIRAFEIYQENRRNQKDICPNSCLFTNMYFGPPVTGINGAERANYAWGVFYFRRDIKTTNEYVLFTILSMLAEIGGYVGLLLGASLANIGAINNWILDLCIGKNKSIVKEKKKSKGKVVKVKEAANESSNHI